MTHATGVCDCARFPRRHARDRLCGLDFNSFLGEVQWRLIEMGYHPPLWPSPKIRDQGDLDAALDSCVQWCAARLDECTRSESGKQEWRPMFSAPLDGTEIEILFRHPSYAMELKLNGIEPAKKLWEAVQKAKWIDHNGGGWTWSGMAGSPLAWRPL